MDVLDKDKAIKVVSNQAALWDANKALEITSTVIQQHPDLCASVGFWGIMESGAAQAIRNAGKIDKVKVYASGEGSQLDCDQLTQGNFYKFLSYTATEQGHDAFVAAETLLQAGEKPGGKLKCTTRGRFGSIRATPAAPTATLCRSRRPRRHRINLALARDRGRTARSRC